LSSTTAPEHYLTARGLVKTFRTPAHEVRVLRGADLDVRRGEMLAIVGASGAGKSTLLHVLGTLDEPDAGSVALEGRDPFALPEEERTRLRNETIGFVFQFHHLLPEFTALENVAMPLFIARKSEEEARARATALLRQLDLAERAEHRPSQLSGGEQQRVAVARALSMEPRLLLADEPTGNLDSSNSRELMALLRELHTERGLTTVLVTHSETVASVCERTTFMEDGRLDGAAT
jgi:lipoprotein-releasing system ATP-binding protein